MKKILAALVIVGVLFTPAASIAQVYYISTTNATLNSTSSLTSNLLAPTSTPQTIATTSVVVSMPIVPISSPSNCVNIGVTLRYLDTDATTSGNVTILQRFLNARNYLQVQPTGYYGLLTRNAVTAFQVQYGLSANPIGFVGPQTREKIREVSCNTFTQIPSTPIYSAPDCRVGDVFSTRTGQRCAPLTSGDITPYQASTSTTTSATTTNPLAPPITLPYILITAVTPETSVASTTRLVTTRWTAETISTVSIALKNNSTLAVIDFASSTPNDGIQSVMLSSAIIPDGQYSMMVYWPSNHYANSVSPISTVSVVNRIITIRPYPSPNATSTVNDAYAAQQQAIADYNNQAQELQKEAEEGRRRVREADSPEEKQSALQEMCSGWKFWINPGDCSAIRLLGI